MSKIFICGMGIGNKEYILPKVFKIAKEVDTLIGGKRHLALFDGNKKKIEIGKNLDKVLNYIKEHHRKEQIAVFLSGDPMFHSFYKAVKKQIPTLSYDIIPGISSFQYFFAKLGMSYEDVILESVHGKKCNLPRLLKKRKLFLLTDFKISPAAICKFLTEIGEGERKVFIGERLSYEDERILEGKAEEFVSEKFKMAVIYIE